MASQVFINLPVTDLDRSMKFYTGLGFTNNPQFSDESGKCMVWSDAIFVMILSHEKFKSFTSRPIADTKNNIAGLFSLSLESVDKMNQVTEAVLMPVAKSRCQCGIMDLCSSGQWKIRTGIPGSCFIWTLASSRSNRI